MQRQATGSRAPLRAFKRRVVLAVLGVSLAGCAATGTVRDLNVRDWVGHSEQHLVTAWGAPHHSYTMVAGGKMIGYQFTDRTVSWWPKGQMITQIRNCMVNFETDRAGTILDASATGVTCRIGPHDQMHPPATKS